MRREEIITEEEYNELVIRVGVGANRISKAIVGDYFHDDSRSIMGRYLKRVACDYYNARRVLYTVIGKSVSEWVEEDAWCFFDYAIASYHVDNNHEIALKRSYLVRQWLLENEDRIVFMSLREVDIAINMLINDKQKLKERSIG